MTDVALEDLGHKERLHPLFLLTGLGKVARNAWGLIAGGAFLAIQDRWGLALLVAGLVIGASLVSLLIRWLTFEYRLGEHELRIDQGLLSRSSRAIMASMPGKSGSWKPGSARTPEKVAL